MGHVCPRCARQGAHTTSDTLCDACLKEIEGPCFSDHVCDDSCDLKMHVRHHTEGFRGPGGVCDKAGRHLADECDAALKERPARPSWDDLWMRLAEDLARRSTCERLSVGCVVVSKDNTVVLGLGYNGGPMGLSNECLSLTPGNCGHLHAEINALIKTNYRDAASKKVYVTTEPCYGCAVALVNAGVREVVYRHEYRDHAGIGLLREAAVFVRKLA
jgi:dCMP deaminase